MKVVPVSEDEPVFHDFTFADLPPHLSSLSLWEVLKNDSFFSLWVDYFFWKSNSLVAE